MNYYTANLMPEDREEVINVVNSTLSKDDVLYIFTSEDAMAKRMSILYKDELNCGLVCTCYAAIPETVFDIDTEVYCAYDPMLRDNNFILQICGLHFDSPYRYPNIFNVSWSIWKKPVTLEQLLIKRFGYHINPYTGYVEYIRDYTNAYKKFIEEFDKEHWANV